MGYYICALVTGGPDLVGADSVVERWVHPQHALVRPEEFVGRASEEIAPERGDVGHEMRHGLDGIDIEERVAICAETASPMQRHSSRCVVSPKSPPIAC